MSDGITDGMRGGADPKPEPAAADEAVLKCIYCTKEISDEELEGDTPLATRFIDLSLSDLGNPSVDPVFSKTDGSHYACAAEHAPIGSFPEEPPGQEVEPWELEWHDVLLYASSVRNRIREAAEPLPEAGSNGAGVLHLAGALPAPTRPLHIGHPTIEAWFHLFDLEVVSQAHDAMVERAAPSEDEQIFGAALPLPAPGFFPLGGIDAAPQGLEDLKKSQERYQALLPAVEAAFVQLKRYCKTAQRAPAPPLVDAVKSLQHQVASLQAQLADTTAKERAFGPTF